MSKMDELPEKKQEPSPEEEALATRLLTEWQRRLEEKDAALNSDLVKMSGEMCEFQNYLTNEKGWSWAELLCELEDLTKKKSPASFIAWHKMLQNFATRNGFDIWKAKISKDKTNNSHTAQP